MRAKTRPWKSIIALILAIGAAVTAGWAHKQFFATDPSLGWIITTTNAVAFVAFASAAIIGLSGKAMSVLEPVMGTAHAAIVRYALVLIGAITTLVVTLLLLGVPIGQLLVGGALTSVFVGIAAQQALSNVFAGMVLLLARPFKVGDAIRMRAGALAGEVDGTVTEIGITYLRLSTITGMLSVPNSQVLNAVIGPLPPRDTQPPITPDPWPQALAPSSALGGAPQGPSPAGSSAGPVGTADGAGGAHRPGVTSGEQ